MIFAILINNINRISLELINISTMKESKGARNSNGRRNTTLTGLRERAEDEEGRRGGWASAGALNGVAGFRRLRDIWNFL